MYGQLSSALFRPSTVFKYFIIQHIKHFLWLLIFLYFSWGRLFLKPLPEHIKKCQLSFLLFFARTPDSPILLKKMSSEKYRQNRIKHVRLFELTHKRKNLLSFFKASSRLISTQKIHTPQNHFLTKNKTNIQC